MDTGIAKSTREYCNAAQALMEAQKHDLLNNHKQPHQDHAFPTQYLGGLIVILGM